MKNSISFVFPFFSSLLFAGSSLAGVRGCPSFSPKTGAPLLEGKYDGTNYALQINWDKNPVPCKYKDIKTQDYLFCEDGSMLEGGRAFPSDKIWSKSNQKWFELVDNVVTRQDGSKLIGRSYSKCREETWAGNTADCLDVFIYYKKTVVGDIPIIQIKEDTGICKYTSKSDF